jgi:uncharacterized protein YlxW (UPF0749 family)
MDPLAVGTFVTQAIAAGTALSALMLAVLAVARFRREQTGMLVTQATAIVAGMDTLAEQQRAIAEEMRRERDEARSERDVGRRENAALLVEVADLREECAALRSEVSKLRCTIEAARRGVDP